MKRMYLEKNLVLFVVIVVIAAPFFAPNIGDALSSETMAFSEGGPFGLGYDYIGRPIAPQLLLGGRDLMIASFLSALFSRMLGFMAGCWIALKKSNGRIVRFLLDGVLVLPMAVLSLATYEAFGGSIYAMIPISCFLYLPFLSRYYESLVRPIVNSAFFEYARLQDPHPVRLVFQEVCPILQKNAWTDISQAFISCIYMFSTVIFLGTLQNPGLFLWPRMIADNLPGFGLNPWATLAPLLGILFLTVPLGLAVDCLERRRQ